MQKYPLHPDTALVAALVVFFSLLIAFFSVYSKDFSLGQGMRACTQEARICPDGSAVTRTGPQCAFAPCPHDNLPNRPGITEEPFEVPIEKVPTKPTQKEALVEKTNKKVLCTQEVKLCPDGSFVGRTGPTCAFAPCPDSSELDR